MGIIEKMRLDGKAIYVTGGASGIGKSVATALAEAGADVAIVDINLEGAESTAKEIAEATGSKTIQVRCDLQGRCGGYGRKGSRYIREAGCVLQ